MRSRKLCLACLASHFSICSMNLSSSSADMVLALVYVFGTLKYYAYVLEETVNNFTRQEPVHKISTGLPHGFFPVTIQKALL